MASTDISNRFGSAAGVRTKAVERGALLRSVPIRWRIFAIALLNTIALLVLAGFVGQGARVLGAAWAEVRQARTTDRLLMSVRSDVGRLQNLIHRYLAQATPEMLAEIDWQRDELLQRLANAGAAEAALSPEVAKLAETSKAFLAGFEELKAVRGALVQTYDREVLKPAREMAGLYGIIDSATVNKGSLIWPALGKSRESYSTALVAANAFYLGQELRAVSDTRESLATIERTIPVMLDLADNTLQKTALQALGQRAGAFRAGFDHLATSFSRQNTLLRTAVDANQAAMTATIDSLSGAVRATEEAAQARFDEAVQGVYARVGMAGLGFMAASILFGIATARSIGQPLQDLQATMQNIVDGLYDRRVSGLEARDEIGAMARAVEVFRKNAVDKQQAQQDLRTAKDRAEAALTELREAQQNLIEAEKLAALGSLVAGVAHEINNPVGISLTVASSLAGRCETFATELQAGPLRRSHLFEFVEGNREAARQLVANLNRAGELVHSFKQVAVDRTHAERRTFDLKEASDQIAASLRPGARQCQVALEVGIPKGMIMDSYPGPYGQVLTNLFLNALTHAFKPGQGGTVRISARTLDEAHVEILFEDKGQGMSAEVFRRAFEPFFTTRRGEGGTGLGLHIVYNLVTRRLGGRITLDSCPGDGTRFRIVLPLVAPRDHAMLPPEGAEQHA